MEILSLISCSHRLIKKFRLQNVFTLKRKACVFKFFRFEERFRNLKAPFLWRISVDGSYDEGPALETSAFESLYGGQFTSWINPVDKAKLSCYTPHRHSTTVSLETYLLYSEKESSDLNFPPRSVCGASVLRSARACS